jgi:anti-sigma factor RsiW
VTSTQPSGRPVDLDTLADYVEGVLDADATAEVADLIRDDPAWASTYAGLSAAQPLVATALSSIPDEPMPVDVANRIDGAIRSLDRPSNVVPLSSARARRDRSVLSRGWLKAAAALVLVALGIGLVVRVAGTTAPTGSKSATSGSAGVPMLAPPSGVKVTASGTDYTKSSLATRPGPENAPQATAGGSSATRRPAIAGPGAVSSFGPDRVSSSLRRLTDPDELSTCLSAVAQATGGTPAAVDFALYEHRPALIIGFADLAFSVAVGPSCGEGGAGAALLGRG